MLELSLEQMQQAWGRVKENEGCAGVDGVTIEHYAEHACSLLPELLGQVLNGAYLPLPLLKIVVEKKPGSGSKRTLLVPCIADRIVQTAVAHILSRSFEEEFLGASFAYRPGRSVDRAIARILQWRDRGYGYVVDADIQAYFDSVSHARLIRLLEEQAVEPELLALVKKWVRAEVWDGREVTPLRRGVPQGSPISPLLANFFLTDFDLELEKSDGRLVRYADDFVVLSKTAEAAEAALASINKLLEESGLQLNREKTRITTFAEGFHFLGVYFSGSQVFIPWKEHRKQGRIFFMARAMPRKLLVCYRQAEVSAHPQPTAKKEAKAVPARVTAKSGGALVAYLYISEQGAILRKSGERFLVEKDERVLLDLQYHKLECVLIFGNVQITTQSIAELLEKGILVSFFSRQGRLRGAMTPLRGKNIELRIAQFEAYRDPARALAFAKATVRAKIENGIAVVRRYEDRDRATDETVKLREAMGKAAEASASAPDLAVLDGTEGEAAKAYFEAVMKFQTSEFPWLGRVKHPATDPINALLSLTYTLIMHELTGLLEGMGLDPYLGFLHRVDYGRPSLALDIMEAFRHPVADRLVLTCLDRGMLKADDFQPAGESEGVFLRGSAMKRYFAEYERWMLARPKANAGSDGLPCFRAVLGREVERLARALREQEEWKPFCFADYENATSTGVGAEWNTWSATT